MEKFTASNGRTVHRDVLRLYVDRGGRGLSLSDGDEEALREFFMHERDQELGRWRWPENPDYVVYRKAASASEPHPGVRVVHEATGRSRDIGVEVNNACDPTVSMFGRAARAYFAAHPEKKPWHDAKPGEVWVLTLDGKDVAALYLGESCWKYGPEGLTVYSPGSRITGARRIWPEEGK